MKAQTAFLVPVVLAGLVLLALSAWLGTPSYAGNPVGLTPSVEPPTPTPGTPCITGWKIDDLHVGLPGWTIYARPRDAAAPLLTAVTDGSGRFTFQGLTAGWWTVWEEMQPGWAPVTPWMFDVDVQGGNGCVDVRFKNRQSCANDLFEPDNRVEQAHLSDVNGPAQKHTFEPPSDLDWLSFDALAGWTYVLRTSDLIGETDTVLALVDTDGETVLVTNDDETPNVRNSLIRWRAPAAGRYFISARDLYQTGLRGCLGYQLTLARLSRPILWLPLILVPPQGGSAR